VLAEWQVGQALWAMVWFTLFFIWIWLLIIVFSDIFRSHDMGGFTKFLWIFFVIIMLVPPLVSDDAPSSA